MQQAAVVQVKAGWSVGGPLWYEEPRRTYLVDVGRRMNVDSLRWHELRFLHTGTRIFPLGGGIMKTKRPFLFAQGGNIL